MKPISYFRSPRLAFRHFPLPGRTDRTRRRLSRLWRSTEEEPAFLAKLGDARRRKHKLARLWRVRR